MKEGLEKHFGEQVVDIENQNLPEVEAIEKATPPAENVVETENKEVEAEKSDDFIELGDPAPLEKVEESNDAQETNENPLEMIAEENSHEGEEVPSTNNLPEGIDKLIEFMNETGKGVEEYVALNRDFDSYGEKALLQEYYSKTKSHLNDNELSYLINKKLVIDEDLDDDEVLDRKIALKEELSSARKYLSDQKEKYYTELKANQNVVEESKTSAAKQAQEIAEKQFQEETNKAFKGFEGFVFDLGEKRKPVRYRINDTEELAQKQSSLDKVFGKYFEEGKLNDAVGFHKAVFAAENSDNIASLFFEQGYAKAVEEINKSSKNVDFEPTKNAPSSNSKLAPGQAREIKSPMSQGQKVNLKYTTDF